jgi:hypothetical protein
MRQGGRSVATATDADDNTVSTPATWESRARTWAALAFGLLAVLGTAYYFFVLQAETRRSALESAYAQRVAHLARQAEGKLEAYRDSSQAALGFLQDSSSRSPLSDALLPSYRDFVEDCPSGKDQRLCVARKVADQVARGNGDKELKLEACQKDAKLDGEHLLLPPKKGISAKTGELCGELPLSALFRARAAAPSDTHSRDALDGLVVVDQSGNAIWQDERSRVRVRSLAKLLNPDDKTPKFAASSMTAQVPLGSEPYRVFVEPLKIELPGDAQEKLALCGFLRESSLAAQSQRIDLVSFLWAALLLVFGALSFPVAKLWLLAPRSRFRTSDVRLLVLCAIAATLVTVSVFMGYLARSRLNRHLDTRLGATAEQVVKRLDRKLAEGEHALNAVERRFDFAHAKLSALCETCPFKDPRPLPFPDSEELLDVCECTQQAGQSELFEPDASHVGFQRAFWTDRDGYQQLKLAPGAHATPPLNIAQRSYFRRAVQLAESQRFDQPQPAHAPSAVAIVRSKTSGAMVAITARATSKEDGQTRELNGVLGVEASLDGFNAPLLPPGFQLAVLDEKGKVSLHSDNDGHYGQSIFDEVADLENLGALARASGTLVSYMGEPSRMAMREMSGGLRVLVFAPQAMVDRPVQSMSLATLELCALMLLGGFVLWLSLRFFRLSLHADPTSHPRLSRLLALTTFRPFPELGTLYAWLGISLLIGGSLGSLVALYLRPTPILCGALVLSITVVSYGLLRELKAPMHLARAYATYCFGTSATLLVVPAVLAFAGCYHHFVESMANREVAHVVHTLKHRPDCFREPQSELSSPLHLALEQLKQCSFPPLRESCEDVFALSLTPREESRAASSPPVLAQYLALGPEAGIGSVLNGWIKAPIDAVLRQFPAFSEPLPARTAGFEVFKHDDALLVSATHLVAGKVLDHRVALPELASTDYSKLELAFMLALLIAISFVTFTLWTRSIARLFFIDALVWPCGLPQNAQQIRDQLARLAKETPEAGGNAALLYLHPSPAVVAAVKDTQGVATWPAWAPADCDQGTLLMIEELDAVFDSDAVLSGLEQALAQGLQIVVFSHVDPLAAPPSERRDRWLALFARFSCLHGTHYNHVRADSPAAIALAWAASTRDEKRVLAQLAFDGHASPSRQNLPVMRSLVTRGLLDPGTFELTHLALRDYVRGKSSTAELREQEAKDGGSPWNMLRVPIVTAVLVLLAGVGQREPDAATLALPGLALSVPLMLRALISVASTRLGGDKAG